MAEYIVKFRAFHYYVESEDPITGDTIVGEQMAVHGERLSTEKSGDDPQVRYGLRRPDVVRGLRLEAFFTDAEVEAMEAGVTDDVTPFEGEAQPEGDTHTSHATMSDSDLDMSKLGVHPLAFEEMADWQLAEVLRALPEEDIIEAVEGKPELAGKFLAGERYLAADAGTEPRDSLISALKAEMGSGDAPEGSEGVDVPPPPDGQGTEASPAVDEDHPAPPPEPPVEETPPEPGTPPVGTPEIDAKGNEVGSSGSDGDAPAQMNLDKASRDEMVAFYNDNLSTGEDDKLAGNVSKDDAKQAVEGKLGAAQD